MIKIVGQKQVFQNIFKTISKVADEAKLGIGKTKLYCSMVDPSHIAMMSLEISKEQFSTFETGFASREIGLNVVKVLKVLALAEDEVTLELDDDTNELVISFGNVERKIVLLDIDGMNAPKIPDLQLPCKLSLDGKHLSKFIRMGNDIADYAQLNVSRDGIVFSNTCEIGSGKMTIEAPDLLELECEEEIESMYALDYFSRLLNGVTSPIKFSLGSAFPLRMDFESNGCTVMFMLAPRIDSS